MEAQQSARKARREGMTPAPTTASCQRSLPVPSTVEDKENKPSTNVFQSGGSSLDGSFYANGVTYEDMMSKLHAVYKCHLELIVGLKAANS
jgi:hypothetical protein